MNAKNKKTVELSQQECSYHQENHAIRQLYTPPALVCLTLENIAGGPTTQPILEVTNGFLTTIGS